MMLQMGVYMALLINEGARTTLEVEVYYQSKSGITC